MKRFLSFVVIATVCFASVPQSAFAIKPFNDAWNKYYVEESDNEDFKKLAGESKCNVCHVDGQDKKKVRNEYGEALGKLLKAADYKGPRLKEEAEKVKEELEAAFKKVEEEKNKAGETFKERLDKHLLPGGDVKGK
jgi:seryl-tRNA synthetase